MRHDLDLFSLCGERREVSPNIFIYQPNSSSPATGSFGRRVNISNEMAAYTCTLAISLICIMLLGIVQLSWIPFEAYSIFLAFYRCCSYKTKCHCIINYRPNQQNPKSLASGLINQGRAEMYQVRGRRGLIYKTF